jgi:hypothetical protein
MIKYVSCLCDNVFSSMTSKSIKQYYTQETIELCLSHFSYIEEDALTFARATWLV